MSGQTQPTAAKMHMIPKPAPDSVREEVMQALPDGKRWLATAHPLLGGRTPNDCLQEGESAIVADLLHSILYVGIS